MPASEDKAVLLLQQQRYTLAEAECRLLVAEEPNDATPRQLLARALQGQEKHAAALQEAREAVRLEPDNSVAYFTLADVHLSADELTEANVAIERAIELDPHDPDCYAVRAAIRLRRDKLAAALEAAEEGLALDAEHRACASLRTQALTRLGRRDEAQSTLTELLARDPDDEVTHCNLGWEMLHAGRTADAITHFREALRIDPEYEYARQGYIEAMKSKHSLYGLLLRGLSVTSRWPVWVQWGLMIAYLVGLQRLRIAARDAGPYVKVSFTMLNLLLLFFWLFVTTASPLLLLTLRFSRDGRHILSPTQRAASTWHAMLFVLAVIALAAWWLIGLPTSMILALVFGLLIPMVSHIYVCPPGRPRRLMAAYVIVVGLIGFLSAPLVAMLAALGLLYLHLAAGLIGLGLILHHPKLFIVFAIGCLCSHLVANHLAAQHRRRAEEAG